MRSLFLENVPSGGTASKWTRVLSKMVLCMLLTVAVFAQSDRGTITGTVLDPASAVVPGAKIVAINTLTGVKTDAVATDTGNFTLASLPAGIYDLIVDAGGFKKTTRTGVEVQVAQIARIDLRLEIGSPTESVTITAETPMLRTENAEQSM